MQEQEIFAQIAYEYVVDLLASVVRSSLTLAADQPAADAQQMGRTALALKRYNKRIARDKVKQARKVVSATGSVTIYDAALNGNGIRLRRKKKKAPVEPKRHMNAIRSTSSSASVTNIDWPAATDFNVEMGRAKIMEYIDKTWHYNSVSLSYTVDYMYTAVLSSIRRYKYRVCWRWLGRRHRRADRDRSIPPKNNHQNGADQCTTCVYFNVDVPINPRPHSNNDHIEVTYTFANDRQIHKPGKSKHHMKFLAELADEESTSTTTLSL